MKLFNSIVILGATVILNGCTTSSQVQELIDASQQDFLQKNSENARSIDVLKKTAKHSIKKDREHDVLMMNLKQQLQEAENALKILQETAEADNKPDDQEVVIERNPILLDQPIEIVAPDTSSPASTAPAE